MTYEQLSAEMKRLSLDFSRGLITEKELTDETIDAVNRWMNTEVDKLVNA